MKRVAALTGSTRILAVTLFGALGFVGGAAANEPPATTGDSTTIATALKGDKAWWAALSTEERVRVGNLLVNDAFKTLSSQEPQRDRAHALKVLDALATYAPRTPQRALVESLYLDSLEKADPKAFEQRLDKLARDANADVARMVANKRFVRSLSTTPVELKYPDLDGRMIDLAQYRGKVVLLDFWATWCKPCMEEMPKIRALYDKYREQGFEVIGVTDDIPGKMTDERLKATMKKAGMNWPQLWDRTPPAEHAMKPLTAKFEVKSLPTQFLFGRDGRLLSRDTKGEQLEEKVRKALGLKASDAK